MNREEFLKELERLLMNIPENDRLDAIAYYNDYFNDAGEENEQNVILELGSPEKVAEKIREELGTSYSDASKDYLEPQEYSSTQKESGSQDFRKSQNDNASPENNYPQEKKKTPWVLIIILLILTFPIWIGIAACLFGVLVSVLAVLFSIICALAGSGVGLTVGGIACIFAGILRFFSNPFEAIVTLGVGTILTAIGLLLFLLFAWITFKWIPLLFKALIGLCKRLFRKDKKGGNEI